MLTDSQVTTALADLGTAYTIDAAEIPKTPEDVPATMVYISSAPRTTNKNYAATFKIEDDHGNEGIVLVKRSMGQLVELYELAKTKGDKVPVIVFSDDGGVAMPFTNADRRRWLDKISA